MDLIGLADSGRAMPSARAATPSGLSRFASSCQHRIAIAWRALFPFVHVHEWEDGFAFASCVEVTIPTGEQRPVSWQVRQFCATCEMDRRRQLTRVEYDCWIDYLLDRFCNGDGHVPVDELPVAMEAVLRLTWRADGGLRVHSPTHPGLVLSHSRSDLVMQDVLPVLSEMGFAASGIETEGHDGATRHGAEHESPTAESGDAQSKSLSTKDQAS